MLGQAETLLVELIEKGGPWGFIAALLFVAWRVWGKIEPYVKKSLDLKEREVTAREAAKPVAEKSHEVGNRIAKAVDHLADEAERLRKNGSKQEAKLEAKPETKPKPSPA